MTPEWLDVQELQSINPHILEDARPVTTAHGSGQERLSLVGSIPPFNLEDYRCDDTPRFRFQRS